MRELVAPAAVPAQLARSVCPLVDEAREVGRRELPWLWLVLGVALLRLAIAPFFELFPQEAYYDLYARHLALSYFDHPPLIAWALWAFTKAFGQHAIVLRLCAFSLTAATQALFWQLVREAVPTARRGPALLWLVTPAVSVLALISNPDVPLVLFWTACLWALWRALTRDARWFALAGLCAGLAFDGKYTAAYLPMGFALLALASREVRARARSRWLALGALLGALATAPVWIWNARHGFASLRFQTVDRAAAAPGLQLRFLGGLVGTQIVLVGVALFGALLFVGGRYLWRRRFGLAAGAADALATDFFAAFCLPPVFGFVAISLVAQVKPNWLLPFYVAAVPFLALALPRPSRLVWPTLAWSAVVQVLAAIELIAMPVAIRSDDTCIGWQALSTQVAALRPATGFVFSADGYKTAAELELYSGQKTYAGNVLGLPGLQYDYLGDDLDALRGQDALFIDSDPRDLSPRPAPEPPPRLADHFARVTQRAPLIVTDHTRPVRKFYLWDCRGYLGPRLQEVPSPLPLPSEGERGSRSEFHANPD